MTDRSPRPMSLVGIGILTAILHQVIALWLFFLEMMRGEAARPLDLFDYALYVICWPFALASRDPLHTRNSLLIISWFSGSLFWAAVVCLIFALYRKKHFRDARD